MAMETVTNYTCDRCGRSEIRDGVTVLTLTVRMRTEGTPGQGKSVLTAHVCREFCVRFIERETTFHGMQHGGRKPDPKTPKTPKTPETLKISKTGRTAQGRTKRDTKKAPAPVSRKITASEPTDTRADTVRAVRALTRVNGGGFAPGYNHQTERRMIAEREALTASE